MLPKLIRGPWYVSSPRLLHAPSAYTNQLQLASDNPKSISDPSNLIALSNRTGFETTIRIDSASSISISPRRYLAAAALDNHGDVLGSTSVIDMRTGEPLKFSSEISTLKLRPRSMVYGWTGFGGVAMVVLVAVVAYCVLAMRKRQGGDVHLLAS